MFTDDLGHGSHVLLHHLHVPESRGGGNSLLQIEGGEAIDFSGPGWGGCNSLLQTGGAPEGGVQGLTSGGSTDRSGYHS